MGHGRQDTIEFVIFGIGNPGWRYRSTRHNVGFMVIDELSRHLGIKVKRRAFQSRIGGGEIGGHRVLLVKPQTYVNLSGNAIEPIVKTFQLPLSNLLVIVDDVNLPLGKLRLRMSGSDGGHKGLRSITEAIGSQGFPRLRLGIGQPPPEMTIVDYVLTPFSCAEREVMKETLRRAAEAVVTFITEGAEAAMSRFNA